MIASSLIVPTETPLAIDELKRALVTYDKVYLTSPDDREFIPPNVYTDAQYLSLPYLKGVQFDFPFGIMGHADGPVRPLGKIEAYDDEFQRTLDKAKFALALDKIEILTAPAYEMMSTIGAIPLPPDTPNPVFTYVNYRKMAEDQDYIDAMSEGVVKLDLKRVKDVSALAPPGDEDVDFKLSGVQLTTKAKVRTIGKSDDELQVLTKLCHARIGTLSKWLGYCHNKKLTPFTTDKGIANVLSRLEYSFIGNFEEIKEATDAVKIQKRLNAIEDLIFTEYISSAKLNELSIKEIISLRTKAWGKANESKSKFFESVRVLAAEIGGDDKFRVESQRLMNIYLKQIEDYRNEMERLKLSVVWNVNSLTVFSQQGQELIEKLVKAPSIEVLLFVGLLILNNFKDNGLAYIDLMDRAREMKDNPMYSVYNNYKYLM